MEKLMKDVKNMVACGVGLEDAINDVANINAGSYESYMLIYESLKKMSV